jgi:hypothetical protein
MNSFVTPPGMPEGWTPPASDAVVEKHVGVPISRILEICYSQCIVREQNVEELTSVVDQLAVILEEFNSKKIDSTQLAVKVGDWRNNVFQNCSADDTTRTLWEEAIVAVLRDSNT